MNGLSSNKTFFKYKKEVTKLILRYKKVRNSEKKKTINFVLNFVKKKVVNGFLTSRYEKSGHLTNMYKI